VSAREPRVVVLLTEGCHLCEDACAIVASVCEQTGQQWLARDLSEVDEPTRSRWREYVPVVLIDGEVHDIFRVTADRLRAALS
jgi:Glutaredoxin-like domain (DUF836)